MFDVLIQGGQLIDGSGAPPRLADIGWVDDRITAIGNLGQAPSAQTIDARGLTVTPGFIDIHTHSDFTLLVDGRAESAIRQGVTTEVVGQCGFSAAPMGPQADASQLIGHIEAGVAVDWRSFGEYLQRLQAARPAVNVMAFVGHGALRRAAPAADTAALVRLAEAAFDEGAAGLSTGLEYWPGNGAEAAEIEALAAVAARRDGLYATHVRNRDVDCERGFAEAIRTARRSGARLQVSHVQPKHGAPPGAMAQALQAFDDARREGIDLAFDLIPHEWSHTVVVSALPAWAREGGTAATLARLRDPAQRRRMRHNPQPIWRLVNDGLWQRIVLLRSAAHPEWVGQDFATLARLRGTDGHELMFDLLLEEDQAMPQMMWTARNFDDDDICLCLRHAQCSVMSDTLSVARDGPLAGTLGSLGGYGWTARLLGHYARDRGVLDLAEAVHRITGRPAARLQLPDRGLLRVGAAADVVVFDAQRIACQATLEQPATHPQGLHHVWVNGVAALRDGARQPQRSGRVLRR